MCQKTSVQKQNQRRSVLFFSVFAFCLFVCKFRFETIFQEDQMKNINWHVNVESFQHLMNIQSLSSCRNKEMEAKQTECRALCVWKRKVHFDFFNYCQKLICTRGRHEPLSDIVCIKHCQQSSKVRILISFFRMVFVLRSFSSLDAKKKKKMNTVHFCCFSSDSYARSRQR